MRAFSRSQALAPFLASLTGLTFLDLKWVSLGLSVFQGHNLIHVQNHTRVSCHAYSENASLTSYHHYDCTPQAPLTLNARRFQTHCWHLIVAMSYFSCVCRCMRACVRARVCLSLALQPIYLSVLLQKQRVTACWRNSLGSFAGLPRLAKDVVDQVDAVLLLPCTMDGPKEKPVGTRF